MSHHFDTPTGKEDPRINLCDFYLFQGRPQRTVMAMTVNPNAGVSAPDTFREEGIYAFRFDLDGDAREDVTFKVCFGPVAHAEGDEHKHVQTFEVRLATGDGARSGPEGELISAGYTGEVAKNDSGIEVFAGLAPDLFAGDAVALRTFLTATYKENRFYPEAFQNRQNFFARKNVSAIVLEVPNRLIGDGTVRSWATISLYGHAPEVQVARWGLPLITHLFLSDPSLQEVKEEYNRAVPAEDEKRFGPVIGKFAELTTSFAGSVKTPKDYANKLVARLCPTTLPYELGTPASFDYAGFNGRGLTDDTMDVVLTLATNTPLGDGVAPDKGRTRNTFPYFGEPYSESELTIPKK
jgi:Domain of unknown function (DUF4331)